jgi:hypothetical protein
VSEQAKQACCKRTRAARHSAVETVSPSLAERNFDWRERLDPSGLPHSASDRMLCGQANNW